MAMASSITTPTISTRASMVTLLRVKSSAFIMPKVAILDPAGERQAHAAAVRLRVARHLEREGHLDVVLEHNAAGLRDL